MVGGDYLENMLYEYEFPGEGKKPVGLAWNAFADLVQIEVIHVCDSDLMAKYGAQVCLDFPWMADYVPYVMQPLQNRREC